VKYSRDDLDEAVGALLQEACARFVMPRYGHLRQDEVDEKSSPTDLVTIADREAEIFLTPRLRDLIDEEVIGEEACAENPDILQRAAAPVAWTVDPVDGTGNFVKGNERFCCMVALLEAGRPIRSWIYVPLQARLYSAMAGHGAIVKEDDGEWQRLNLTPRDWHTDDLTGSANILAVAEPRRDIIRERLRNLPGRWFAGSSGIMGTEIASGRQHFMLHSLCTPWDHAPVDLLCREAGAHAAMIDDDAAFNADYARAFMIAPDRQAWDSLRDRIWR
jgi:fructose-1,6-bisphosphatase/inositol monophosphatase family enzyme